MEKITNYLSNDIVAKILEMNRGVNNEAHHYTGFLRFKQIDHNILFSKIKPKNDIITLLAPHFADRLNQENFIIYDEIRKTAIIHRQGMPWFYTTANSLNPDILNATSNEEEEEYKELWKVFFHSVAIDERKNSKLQRNNLPLRFRSNMLEFDENTLIE